MTVDHSSSMFVNKRSTTSEHETNKHHEKKKRNDLATIERTSCLEDLSNELFFEIFEYLDGADVYETFSNLNSRLEKIVNDLSFPLRLTSRYVMQEGPKHYCENIVVPNAHRIVSMDFHTFESCQYHPIFKQHVLDGSFRRLESITIVVGDQAEQYPWIFRQLKYFPSLHNLEICFHYDSYDATENVYRLLFSLVTLKRLKTNFHGALDTIDQIASPIRYLTLGHSLSIDVLLTLLQLTPDLRQLVCGQLYDSNQQNQLMKILKLSNLKYLRLGFINVEMNEIETLLEIIGREVQFIELTNNRFDRDYLDGSRWERFIEKHIPYLKEFYLATNERIDVLRPSIQDPIQRFSSSFWLRRHTSCRIEMSPIQTRIIFVSNEEQWFQKHQRLESELHSAIVSTDRNQIFVLLEVTCLRCLALQYGVDPFVEMKSMLNPFGFHQLTVEMSDESVDLRLGFVQQSSNCDSLVLIKEYEAPPNYCRTDLEQRLLEFANNNKITKLKLESLRREQQISQLLKLFPRLEYFELACLCNLDLIRFLRLILIDHIGQLPNLRSLCFNMITAVYKSTSMIREIVENETTIQPHTLKRFGKQIFLQWKPK